MTSYEDYSSDNKQLMQDIADGKVIRDFNGRRWKRDLETGKNIWFCEGADNMCNKETTGGHCRYCSKGYCDDHFLTHQCFELYGLVTIFAIRDDIEGDVEYYTNSLQTAEAEVKRLQDEDNRGYYYTVEYMRTK